jgi:hypothetical protein
MKTPVPKNPKTKKISKMTRIAATIAQGRRMIKFLLIQALLKFSLCVFQTKTPMMENLIASPPCIHPSLET